MAYNKSKDLEKKTQSDIVLKNKALEIASNPKYNKIAKYNKGIKFFVCVITVLVDMLGSFL